MRRAQEITSRALAQVEARQITQDALPMGGCSTWRAHEAHLAAGDSACENEHEATTPTSPDKGTHQ
jgi:hypothetical protein